MTLSDTADRKKRLTRIRRVSGIMKWVVTVVLAVILFFGVIITISIALPNEFMIAADDTLDVADVERNLREVPQLQRVGIAALAAIAFTLLMIAGWNIRQVFNRFQQMEFFSPKTLANVIAFGTWLIAFAVFDLISDPLGSFILTLDLPPGERQVDITLDGGEIFFLVLGALMLLFGWILREAALIADENRQFV